MFFVPRRPKLSARLERIFSSVRRLGRQRGPVPLSEEYRALVRACEERAANRSGSDKTWVEESDRQFREHYRNAKLVH